ncbi:MAG: DUF1722 domain-containing protein [Deltaproteobacteria bacterium]|nr:DUF1722 domain-containing protein [Deltaproteobacteria bacterium]MCL4873318.1 DUF1722 domain-containing protein [bacterium]
MQKIKLGISSCLLGEKVRYDGTHQRDRYITDTLGKYFEWVPVCPEVEYGLPVPREAMRLKATPEGQRLVTRKTGIDHTEGMREWVREKLDELEKEFLSGFIFKAKSPSSGLYGVKLYGASGPPSKKGVGIFGGAFVERFPLVPAEDDGRLHDPKLRENFIERVFVYRRWQELMRKPGSADLVEFHTRHKLLILAHSPLHYSRLGKMAAKAGKSGREGLYSEYGKALMEGLRLIATTRKNTNVLYHLMGYFKEKLSETEKEEMLEVIGDYRKGLIPLIVPVVLVNHYVRLFKEQYLEKQYYLNPHPIELMLRNHV